VQVLLVEDEALVAMVAEEALIGLGFVPLSCRTAQEALDQFSRDSVVMAIVDIGLPDVRGDVLASRLRALAPELPIIVASGYDETELKSRFVGDARVKIVSKPYTESDLGRAARALGVNPHEVIAS
jgi:CheY-like chemotaxis protein